MNFDHADTRFATLGLEACDPEQTYLDDYELTWIGAKWDVAYDGDRFHLYRKGNWRLAVASVDLAESIIRDQEHLSPAHQHPDLTP